MDFTIQNIPKLISIEGNIGAGKTTFVHQLQKHFKNNTDIIFITEPVDIWENIKDSNNISILEKFYNDPEKYAFSFQIMAYVTRLNLITKAIVDNPQCKLIITERSLDADRNVFAKMLYDDGLIEDINYNIYLQFYNSYKEKYKSSGIIYINADPAICDVRINKRNRSGEDSVKLSYLEKCGKYHNTWIHSQSNILSIDANCNATYNKEVKSDPGINWIQSAKIYIKSIVTPKMRQIPIKN